MQSLATAPPHPSWSAAAGPTSHAFNPYTDNGGTIVAVAGQDYCIVASDTRQSQGYSINTRYAPRVFQLTSKCCMASSGMYADITALNKRLKIELELYKYNHGQELSTPGLAEMLSKTLYYKRFFPYYSYNIVGGLDENGVGAVYHFDVVGSFQRESYRADGSAQTLIQPFLDNQVGFKNQNLAHPPALPLDYALRLVRDAFTAATERDIYTGDFLECHVITRDGVRVEKYDLKKD